MTSSRSLEALGWDGDRAIEAAEAGGTPARVVRQDRGWVQVEDAAGARSARTRADRVGTPVVGDWVTLDEDTGEPDPEVVTVLTRRNELRRADPVGEGAQVLAANIDRVLLVLGLDRPVKDGRIQRAAVQACDAEAGFTVVLTKIDLLDDREGVAGAGTGAVDRVVDEIAVRHPGNEVLAVSSWTGRGVDELHRVVAGSTVVLIGESGAGKSSLLNALAGSRRSSTGTVRGRDAKGRHTTTRRELYRLPGTGLVVDTPGIRAIGIWADPVAVDEAFGDVAALAPACRFGDCGHGGEPGCAVAEAVDDGRLSAERLSEYRALRAEAEWSMLPEHARGRGRRPG